MKKKYLVFLTSAILLVGAVLAVSGVKSHLQTNLKQVADSTISDVDLTKIQDGIYIGSYKAFPVSAEVKVVISNHRISKIELIKHINGQGALAEVIPEKVVKAQSLKVDIVSGATYSSKVILKAIETALTSGTK
jgi:uncharacterized protein with FMN-binding domain